MSGRKSFANLKAPIEANPERRARLDEERAVIRAVLSLSAIREARGATQQQLADAWEVSQANVSQVERTSDIHLSTLRRYVAALGGHVEVRAVFPDGSVAIIGEQDAGVGAPSHPEAARR